MQSTLRRLVDSLGWLLCPGNETAPAPSAGAEGAALRPALGDVEVHTVVLTLVEVEGNLMDSAEREFASLAGAPLGARDSAPQETRERYLELGSTLRQDARSRFGCEAESEYPFS